MQKKRIILKTLVVFEIVGGTLLLYWFYQLRFPSAKVLGDQSVAVINKENVITSAASRFKYYTELRPNSTDYDHPSWLPYQATYTFNSDGINDTSNYTIEKPVNTYRIIALGDSFTFGHYVNTVDSWPEQLETMLTLNGNLCSGKKIEVLNLGMRGFDIPYIVERYKTIGNKYHPDLIIWMESGSGYFRNIELMQPLIEECNQNLRLSSSSDLNMAKTDYNYCWHEAEYKVEKEYTQEGLVKLLDPYWDDFYRTVDPSLVYYLTFKSNSENNDLSHILRSWQEQHPQAHYLSLITDLKGNQLLADEHPSASGHKKIAQTIYSFLVQNQQQFLNCLQ